MMLVSLIFVHCSRRFNSGADGEGEILPGTYAHLPRNHDSGDDAKSNLRKDKPKPVNPLVERGIDGFENAMDQTRPENGGDHASKQNRAARKHRKRDAVKKPDEHLAEHVANLPHYQNTP